MLTEAPGPLSSRSTSVMGLSGRAKRYYFRYSLSCNWDSVLFSHEFLIMPESPSPLLGRDILSKENIWIYGEGNGIPFQYFCLENPMDGEVWWAAVHGVAKSRTRLSNFPSLSVYSWHLFLISSASVRSTHFFPLLCPSLHEMFPWYL